MKKLHNTSVARAKSRHAFLKLLPVVMLLSIRAVRADDDDRPRCRAFYGPFTSTVVSTPPCTSPVGLCTHGILTGEFPATYDFTALTQTSDPSDPNTILLTGKSVVTTARDVIHTDDTSTINLATGEFVTKAIVRRSNLDRDKSGGFVAAGILAAGQAIGNYSAVVCSREDD